jgi:hypothetical protein
MSVMADYAVLIRSTRLGLCNSRKWAVGDHARLAALAMLLAAFVMIKTVWALKWLSLSATG